MLYLFDTFTKIMFKCIDRLVVVHIYYNIFISTLLYRSFLIPRIVAQQSASSLSLNDYEIQRQKNRISYLIRTLFYISSRRFRSRPVYFDFRFLRQYSLSISHTQQRGPQRIFTIRNSLYFVDDVQVDYFHSRRTSVIAKKRG